MATLMQKDVLIEFVAATQALIFRVYSNPSNQGYKLDNGIYQLPDEYRSLGDLKRNMYSLDPSDIDFNQTAEKIRAISDRYKQQEHD